MQPMQRFLEVSHYSSASRDAGNMVEHVTGVQFLMLSAAGMWAMFCCSCGGMLCLRHAATMWVEILHTAVGRTPSRRRHASSLVHLLPTLSLQAESPGWVCSSTWTRLWLTSDSSTQEASEFEPLVALLPLTFSQVQGINPAANRGLDGGRRLAAPSCRRHLAKKEKKKNNTLFPPQLNLLFPAFLCNTAAAQSDKCQTISSTQSLEKHLLVTFA